MQDIYDETGVENVPVTTSVDEITVSTVEETPITMFEAFPSTGNIDSLNHALLNNREADNQHPISSITGLRAELDSIEELQTIYSDKYGSADYYIWSDGNARDEYGYFVSLADKNFAIKICEGTDILGVTISSAAFIGNQSDIVRDNKYGLVATTGVVDVRCETDVQAGDCVVSNAQGIATKTDSGCGYKVVAIEKKFGIQYAVIVLGVQACATDAMGQTIQYLEEQLEDAKTNIAAAMNVANEAHQKANDCIASNEVIGDQVSDALDRVDDMEADVEDMGTQVSNSALVSAQAKAIAESAATSAESMRNEAVEKANEALTDTSKLRKELEDKVAEIDTALDNTMLELQATKESVEATRDELQSDIDNISTELDNTKTELNSTVSQLQQDVDGVVGEIEGIKTDVDKTKDDISADIDAINKDLGETKESLNATKESVESISQEIEPLATWSDGTQSGTAGFVARANDDSTTLAGIVTWQGETNKSIAGFKQEVADTYATIDSVTALETQTSEAIAGVKQEAAETYATIESVATLETNTSSAISAVKQTADNNKAQLDAVSSFTYTDEDGKTSTGLAGLKSQVTDNTAELSTVANYETGNTKGLAGLMAQVDKNKADIALLSQFEDDTGEGLAGLKAQVDANTAELEVIASHTYTDADGNVLKGLAAIDQQVTDQGAEIDSIVSWQGTTNTAIAGIEQKANDNAGSISILTEWKSDVESDVSSIASIKAQSDANKSSIEELTTWQGTTNESLTSVKQQSDANKANIDAITLWQGETTESITEVRQQADDNASSIESLTSWKDDTTETISTIEQTTSAHESSINSLTSWQGEAQTSIANVEQKAGANESKINSLTSWQGEASESIANVEQKATDNEAAIASLTTWKGEATESISAIQQTTNQNSADISLIASWKSDVEDDVSSIASIKTTADTNKASIEQLVKKDTELSTAIAGVKTTADANEASIEQITAWQDKVNPTINSVAGIKQTADGNAAKIEGLTSWQGDTNIAMARIEQKADANGAYIQSTVSSMDKYAVGPYSQAYGFTLEQAREVLEEGMVYVPTGTATHTEKYKYTEVDAGGKEVVKEYTYSFTPGYIYTWSDVDTSAQTETFMWKESVGRVVSFGTAPSGNAYDFWYANSDTVTNGYEPYTLYKLEEYKNEAGETLTQWVAVATLQGNSSNRAVSQIRQDANGIELRVMNVEGSAASSELWIDNNSANIQDVVSWKSDNGESLVTFMQTADDNFASASQVAQIVDEDGNINAASIVTAVNKAGSSVVIDADHINLNGYVTMTNLSTEGETVIDGANIKTGKIDAERIKVEDLQALGATIAGWQIADNQLFYEDPSTGIEVGLSPGQGGTYNTNQNLGLVLYAGEKTTSTINEIAGTYRFSENFSISSYVLNGTVPFKFYGWYNSPDRGWHKYDGADAYLKFVPSFSDPNNPETFIGIDMEFGLSNDTMRRVLWKYRSVGSNPGASDSIGSYLLNRELGFGPEGIRDRNISHAYYASSEYTLLNTVLSETNATHLKGSIGIYPTMLDAEGFFYGNEVRLNGGVIDVDTVVAEKMMCTDSIIQGAGWGSADGVYLGKNGLSVGKHLRLHIGASTPVLSVQDVSASSLILNNANVDLGEDRETGKIHANFITLTDDLECSSIDAVSISTTDSISAQGTVNCKTLSATDIEGDHCTLQSIILNDVNGDGAALLHSDASYVHCNAKFMISVQENGSTSGRWQGMMIDFGANTLQNSSSTALRIGPVNGGFQVSSDGTMNATNPEFSGALYANGEQFLSIPSNIDEGETYYVEFQGLWKDAGGKEVATSDARLKHDIESLDERYDVFFDNLEAQRFKYNVGTSDRYHLGYITQGVQKALATAEIPEKEFAGVVTLNQGTENEESALRYYEFVSLNTDQIQKLKKRVDALEAKNAELEVKNAELEARLAKLEALLINNAE